MSYPAHRVPGNLPSFNCSVSHTTRAPRNNEVNGVDYHFVDRETFNKMIGEGAFVEWASVYDDLYGTSISGLHDQTERGLDVVLDLDSQGAKNIKEGFKDSTLIYILPPSLETLEQRLRERATDDDNVIDNRIERAYKEMKESDQYDYIIINDNLEKAVRETESIIISGRCRNSGMLPKVKDMFGL